MTDKPTFRGFHVLPTASEPNIPGVWDNGDGTYVIYPSLNPDNVRSNRMLHEANNEPRFKVTKPDSRVKRVAGIHFLGFTDGLIRNRYSAAQLVRGLEAAVSLARWLDCAEYGGDWPWVREEGERGKQGQLE